MTSTAKTPAAPTAPTAPTASSSRSDRSLLDLIGAIEAFEAGPVDPGHAPTVRVLRAFANAVAAIGRSDPAALGDARRAIADLEASPKRATDHADLTREALRAIVRALPAAHPPAAGAGCVVAGAAVPGALEALDIDQPLLEQRAPVSEAFRAVADAILCAAGETPYYARRDGADGPRDAASDLVDAGRSWVRKVADASWEELQPSAASGLEVFAQLLARDPRASGGAPDVRPIREVAAALREADPLSGEASGRVKRGLGATLDAFAATRAGKDARLGSWIQSARGAVARIDARTSLSFQRVVLQDAYRAVLDLLAAGLLVGSPAPD